MIAQFVQDLVHLESGEDRLDQHRRLDGAALDAELVLGMVEDVVPEARLEMVLELRQVEVGTGAVFDELPCIVEKVEAEIDKAAGHWLAVDMDMVFGQVPDARPDQQGRVLLVQPVILARCRIGEMDAGSENLRVGEAWVM